MGILRSFNLLVIVWLMLASGCTRAPPTAETPIKAETITELQGYLSTHKANLDEFRLRGPFAVVTQENQKLRLSATERIKTDLFLSAAPEKAPLVIFMHGHDSSKEAHANQAMHLASWGMHSLTLQLSKKGPWVGHGRTVARIVNLIQRLPEVIDSRIDASKIILVGHSFGGSAVAIALAEGARAAGAVLLDPAGVGKGLPKFLQRINRPVMLLGADEAVSMARNRDDFFHFIRSGIAEVSIKDATHEDAQYPSEYAVQNTGYDPHTTEELQITFVSALTSAAFSLSSTGAFDYAWTSFAAAFENRVLINAKKK